MRSMMKFGLCALLAFAAGHADAEVERRPLQIALSAKPLSDDVLQASPIAGAAERAIALRIEDARPGHEGAVVGQAVNDGTVVYPIIATNDVNRYVEDVTRNVIAGWGLKVGEATLGTLTIRYTHFNVAHNNRAVGATYVGDTTIEYSLANRAGRVLAKGTASGNVDHYGKGRSVEGCNEVLSESLAGALSQMLNDPGFRQVWSMSAQAVDAAPVAAKPAPAAKPAKGGKDGKSLQARLRKLDQLHADGAISDEEHRQRRKEILDEI